MLRNAEQLGVYWRCGPRSKTGISNANRLLRFERQSIEANRRIGRLRHLLEHTWPCGLFIARAILGPRSPDGRNRAARDPTGTR